MTNWQLIETAPKDNTLLILHAVIDSCSWIDLGYWETYNGYIGTPPTEPCWDWPFSNFADPTHWMYLPEAPT